jgi:xanthine dehydrogenase accessory factor
VAFASIVRNAIILTVISERDADMRQLNIAILGAGEMATGIAHRLFSCHFTRIVMSEIAIPIAVRRRVAFCEAVYEGRMTVEGVEAELVKDLSELPGVWDRKRIAVLVDGEASFVPVLKPDVLIDAIMAKRQKGPMRELAPFVVGVGPGFSAPDRVDAVIESNRGHNLGRVIYEGEAESYTGLPGTMVGYTKERVLRAPHAGAVRPVKSLGDRVSKGDIVLYVDDTPVVAQIDGVLRGLIRPIHVPEGEKVGDVDPRAEEAYCSTISEKAHAIAGGVLEALLHRYNTTVK